MTLALEVAAHTTLFPQIEMFLVSHHLIVHSAKQLPCSVPSWTSPACCAGPTTSVFDVSLQFYWAHIQVFLNCPNLFSQQESVGFRKPFEDYNVSACSTVKVLLAMFHGSGGVLAPATILVDTDAMANFLHKAFIRKHDLCLQKQSAKSIVFGFKQDWSGHIQLLTLDSKPFNIQISFSVTQLGLVDAIFGLPW
ncbi:hypothetical protein VP01_3078g1 [Puccinia sorghi]|uniref:Uncharacterized protein n=1 Tax=Puccinia sorghi TaxID=27349 RepID=A0A0L6UZQ2_9BASI|nr:hypothetical protein VP01_3078g1 [Puccinia sorghi]